MDTSILTFPLKALWWGGRETYRGIRVLHWMDTDRRDPNLANIAARNIHRDRLTRQWGGKWMGARGLQPLTMAEKWAAGEQFDWMGNYSYDELREYNQLAVRYAIEAPADARIQQIRDAGPTGPDSHLYKQLMSEDSDEVIEGERKIYNIFTHNWHRIQQMAHFKKKIDYEHKIVQKVEKKNIYKFFLQTWQKALHDINDGTIKGLLEKLFKALSDIVA